MSLEIAETIESTPTRIDEDPRRCLARTLTSLVGGALFFCFATYFLKANIQQSTALLSRGAGAGLAKSVGQLGYDRLISRWFSRLSVDKNARTDLCGNHVRVHSSLWMLKTAVWLGVSIAVDTTLAWGATHNGDKAAHFMLFRIAGEAITLAANEWGWTLSSWGVACVPVTAHAPRSSRSARPLPVTAPEVAEGFDLA